MPTGMMAPLPVSGCPGKNELTKCLRAPGSPHHHGFVGPSCFLALALSAALALGSCAAPSNDACSPTDRPAACPGRGLYDGPVTVTLKARDPGRLVYTLDGSTPSAANGRPYSEPLQITGAEGRGTVVLRVAEVGGPVATHTYVFPKYVLSQPTRPAGFPTVWGARDTRESDYALDARALPAAAAATAALAALPTVSLVFALPDLFGDQGIYMNPSEAGVTWERPVSVEMFAGGVDDWQENAGARIQGNSSTQNWKSPKLSIRILWKSLYGPSDLERALFTGSRVNRFDTLVLDAGLNFTWVHPEHEQRIKAQFVRDQFVADLQNALGGLAPHGRFVHLYLNGLYWGIYNLHERPDASFAAQHLGGQRGEYDALRHDGANVVDGDATAWNTLMNRVRRGVRDDDAFEDVARLVDVDGFIDYMILNFFVGNTDWPQHNWYATRKRTDGGRFRFHSWDAERTLSEVEVDRTQVDAANGPGELYQALRAHAGFRDKVRARAAALLGPSGLLGGGRPAELYRKRAAEIESAVWLEAARWGDSARSQPYTRDDWLRERDRLLDGYFPRRAAIVRSQLAN